MRELTTAGTGAAIERAGHVAHRKSARYDFGFGPDRRRDDVTVLAAGTS